jgi:holo-[acyl-carrier protein] synthase
MLTAGVDLVEVARIEQALCRHGDRFLRHVYTQGELAYCAGRPLQLAARFAAKEAAAKALGCGLVALSGGGVNWREIEVVQTRQGQPRLELHGAAHQAALALNILDHSLSMSHTDTLAIALVVMRA